MLSRSVASPELVIRYSSGIFVKLTVKLPVPAFACDAGIALIGEAALFIHRNVAPTALQLLLHLAIGGNELHKLLNEAGVLRAHIRHHLDDLGHREQIVDHQLIS